MPALLIISETRDLLTTYLPPYPTRLCWYRALSRGMRPLVLSWHAVCGTKISDTARCSSRHSEARPVPTRLGSEPYLPTAELGGVRY
eukprot:1947626-Rhodomonas_salina.1